MAIAVAACALSLRLWHVDFGLPALYDADEPLFVLTAMHLIRDHTLDPGWFGHPGTTTIYALAAVILATFGAWHAAGRFADAGAFAKAIYADPSWAFLPGRLFVVACGVAVVWLCWRLAKRLFGERIALLAALLLAIDPLAVRYSQIIRTDMHATVFVLAEMLAAVAIVRCGRTRDYIWAAVWIGFATATKWPMAVCGASALGAVALRWFEHPAERRAIAARSIMLAVVTPIALFAATPFVFLDWRTVAHNVHMEERALHLGATGYGFLGNLGWYVGGPLAVGLGRIGLAAAIAGCWLGARRSRVFAAMVLPVVAIFLLLISAQALVWERWIVPLLPMLSIAAAVTLDALYRAVRVRAGGRPAIAAMLAACVAVVVPMLITVRAQAAERATDTRRLATDWARAHIPAGATVTVEYLAFDVLGQPWRFLYPAGDLGCADVRANLSDKIRYSKIDGWRGPRAIMDVGTIAPDRLATCRGDWAILVDRDRYLAERARFPAEVASYARFLKGAAIVASFAPVPGRIGGPIVRVVRLR